MAVISDIFSKKKAVKENNFKLIVDNRERNSFVFLELQKMGFNIEFKQLAVADYLINGVAIERKTISDFKSSIIDKRIMRQLLELKQYKSHILILEGFDDEDIYSGIIHENAFRGFILSVIKDYKVPLIFTKNWKDTAKYISVLANKKEKKGDSLRASKIFLNEKEQLIFILEGFPNIGPVAARKLLEKFGSLKNIFNATKEELAETIGKKAEILFSHINSTY